jgi:DNA-binding response OmpR family regulator
MSRILVVEDNPQISEVVRCYLERNGHEIVVCGDGPTGLRQFQEHPFDLAILDVMLPEMDGYSLCKEIRKAHDLPILMLSARDEPLDKILGLEVGADDYMAKPFHAPELVLRVEGLLRRATRCRGAEPRLARLQRGELSVDPESRRAHYGEVALKLTRIEFELLQAFAQHPGQVLTREQLIERIWGPSPELEERLVDTHLRNLRSKLRQVQPNLDLIRSIRGVGYRLD